ncbi:MAG: anti-sigma factor [Thiobacillus sp.]|nr:anti-sigma factor [Thiobacillus sp.]
MTDNVSEEDLHAFVDGALSDARRLEVEAWLASHPADAERVQEWMSQNQALHAAFDSVLNEPLPIHLVRAARRQPVRTPYKAIAAALALVASGLVGYGIGLVSDRQGATPPLATSQPLARDAAIAHAVFSPEVRHPVEVEAAHAEHLVSWLSKRVGTELKAPDFAVLGFELLGGRLLTGESGPVAQFMYQDSIGRRVTLYVRRAAAGKAAENQESSFRHVTENGVEVFYWIDRDFGYALSGQIAPADIRKLAGAAYTQLVGHAGGG